MTSPRYRPDLHQRRAESTLNKHMRLLAREEKHIARWTKTVSRLRKLAEKRRAEDLATKVA